MATVVGIVECQKDRWIIRGDPDLSNEGYEWILVWINKSRKCLQGGIQTLISITLKRKTNSSGGWIRVFRNNPISHQSRYEYPEMFRKNK